jgi:hypothetical protein
LREAVIKKSMENVWGEKVEVIWRVGRSGSVHRRGTVRALSSSLRRVIPSLWRWKTGLGIFLVNGFVAVGVSGVVEDIVRFAAR